MGSLFVKDREFYQRLVTVAFPIILQSCITIGINMLDTLMLGSFGEAYLSATSLSNQFFNLYQIICMGLGGGAAVLTAQAWGRRDITAIHKTMTIMLWLTVGIGALFTAVMLVVPQTVMSVYTSDATVIADCVLYYKWLVWAFVINGLSLTLTQVLRSTGKMQIPLYSSIVGFVTNIFFNYALIFGHFGFPRMELEGAALATLIARCCECLMTVVYVFFTDKDIGYRFRSLFESCAGYVQPYITYALPVLASDFLLGIGNNLIAIIMGHISAAFVAAYSITAVVQQMLNVFTSGVMFASSTITGNTLGRGEVQKAYDQGKTFITLSVIFGVIGSVIIFFLKGPIISYYNIADSTKEIAASLMNSVALILIFRMSASVLTKGVLRAGGDTKFLLKADILFLFCASVPLGALAGLVLHLSSFWTYFFLNIDQVIKSIWCIGRFRSKKWINVLEK